MIGIERKMTEQDKLKATMDGEIIKVDLGPSKHLTEEDTFQLELSKHEQEATKNNLPFARHVARADFQDMVNNWQSKLNRQGFVTETKPKAKDVDWKKYSDLKNFEILTEKDIRDTNLSRQHRMPVFLKSRVYKFKGFKEKYRVMEDGDKALERIYAKDESLKSKKR